MAAGGKFVDFFPEDGISPSSPEEDFYKARPGKFFPDAADESVSYYAEYGKTLKYKIPKPRSQNIKGVKKGGYKGGYKK